MSAFSSVLACSVVFCQACALLGRGTSKQKLMELGEIAIPSRLKGYGAAESASFARFTFDRAANSFFMIGSNTPIPEKLVVAVWTPASYQEARRSVIVSAQDRTGGIQWCKEGAFEIGEGLHQVNTFDHPAWVLVADRPDQSITIAYMVWKQDASLDQARATVEAALRSFTPKTAVAGYLRIAADRPAKLKNARMSLLEQMLQTRGIRLQQDGPPVEHQGSFYEMYTDEWRGKLLSVLTPLGDLPSAQRYRHLRPAPPRGIGNWPSIVWFARAGETWERHGIDSDFLLSPRTNQVIGKRHSDKPDRAHFYAVEIYLLEDLEMPEPDLEFFWRASGKMAELFRAGKLVVPEPRP